MTLVCAAAALACGSRYGYNFLDPTEPRYGSTEQRASERHFDGRIKLVSFNIKFGQKDRVEKAIDYLKTEPRFSDPDLLVLQEMSCAGVEKIAAELRGNWVYYPAAWHPQGTQWGSDATKGCPASRVPASGGYFGVGIVTPWTIRDDQKILLPQLSRSDDAQKVALAATIDFAGAYRIRVVDVHLQSGLTPVQLGDQVQVITRCVFEEHCPDGTRPVPVRAWAIGEPHGSGNVILAGDFNTSGEAHVQVLTTLLSPRHRAPMETPTFWLLGFVAPAKGRLDQVFYGDGLAAGKPEVGTIKISDHRPVMVEFTVIESGP